VLRLNRYIGVGFALGLLAVALAVILMFNQYSLSPIIVNRSCEGNYSVNVRGDVLLILNNTGNEAAALNLLINQHIPQTNITIPQEYNISVTPLNTTILTYGQVLGIAINCSSPSLYISVYLLRRPAYYLPLWLIMTASFIFSVALIIIGYLMLLESSISTRGKR